MKELQQKFTWLRGLRIGWLFVVCSLFLFFGCVAQQADVARIKRDLDAKISKLNKSKVELQQAVADANEALQDANSIIVQQRAEIKELLHSRAEVMDQVTTLKEGDLSEVRGDIDKNAHSLLTMAEHVEAMQEAIVKIQQSGAKREETLLPVLQKIQDRVGQQEGLTEAQSAKEEEFRASLVNFKNVLSSLREALTQQESRVNQTKLEIDDLAGRREHDAHQTSVNLEEIKRSIGSVVSALGKVSDSLTRRLDDQEDRLTLLAKSLPSKQVQNVHKAASTRVTPIVENVKEPKTHQRLNPAPTRQSFQNPPALNFSKPLAISSPMPKNSNRAEDAATARYQENFTSLRNGDFNEASRGFTIFLRDYPNSPLAANAQYWLGECYYGQRLFDQAIREFENVFTLYPSSQKAPAALLKIGYSHLELQNSGTARAFFRQVVRIYPKSPEAAKAYARLTEVDSPSKQSS